MSRQKITLIAFCAVIFIAFNVTWIYFVVAYQPYSWKSNEMAPTLFDGEQLYANRNNRDVVRGKVIMFRAPNEPTLIEARRIIGIADDMIVFTDREITLNGEVLPMVAAAPLDAAQTKWEETHQIYEQTLEGKKFLISFRKEHPGSFAGRIKVPPNQVWVLSDNRDDGHDSREFGAVPVDNIINSPSFIYLPIVSGQGWVQGRFLNRIR